MAVEKFPFILPVLLQSAKLLKELLDLLENSSIKSTKSISFIHSCPKCNASIKSDYAIICPTCNKKLRTCFYCSKRSAIIYNDKYGFICKKCGELIGILKSKKTGLNEREKILREVQKLLRGMDKKIDQLRE